jgi:hypothetical protein
MTVLFCSSSSGSSRDLVVVRTPVLSRKEEKMPATATTSSSLVLTNTNPSQAKPSQVEEQYKRDSHYSTHYLLPSTLLYVQETSSLGFKKGGVLLYWSIVLSCRLYLFQERKQARSTLKNKQGCGSHASKQFNRGPRITTVRLSLSPPSLSLD